MESQEILSSMVKSRECCRRLVQSYEAERTRRQTAPATAPASVPMLQNANQAATQILTHLASLPRQPCAAMNEETRAYSSKLLNDIRSLLEKAIMLEREMRTTAPSQTPTGSEEEL
jgi:cell division septum initiation protein DivIVA